MISSSRDRRGIRITVGMPVYNARLYVAAAIESVLSQDFGAYELIVVDDRSSDGTSDILNKYRNHPKVKILTNRKRLGRGATRNRILRLAKGKYFTPCDADDKMLQGNLRKLSAYLDRHPSVGAVYGVMRVHEFDAKGKLVQKRTLARDCEKTWDLLENVINHAGSMIRVSGLRKIGGYAEDVRVAEDWNMWLKLREIAPVKYLDGSPVYLWMRRHSGQRSKVVESDNGRVRREAIERRYGYRSKSRAS